MTVRTRFAPSPTGYLHIGGVRTALFNWLYARQQGGQFILRIDDTDGARNLDEALEPILSGLKWLGIDWDEGPGIGGPHAPYFQSQRAAGHRAAVERLLETGHAYRDFATPAELDEERKQAQAAGLPFLYSRKFAAFTAADELGIYIQSEVVWVQRPLGKDKPGRMEGMPFGTVPESLMNPPGTIDKYVHEEIRRVMDANGNHPSFILFTIGNEMGSYDPEVCGQWIQEIKTCDPRRFYAVSTARRIIPEDDFNVTHAIPNIGWVRDRISPYNDWDYEDSYAKAPVPIIAHEVGQWPAFPTWDEIAKYNGVLRARNYEHFHDLAVSNGVANLDHEFRAASGATPAKNCAMAAS